MKKFVYLVFTLLISFQQIAALSEVDEIGNEIADKIKAGQPVSLEKLNDWVSCCSPEFLTEVYSSFGIDNDLLQAGIDLTPLSEFLTSTLTESSKAVFEITLKKMTVIEQAKIIPLLFNYMIGTLSFK